MHDVFQTIKRSAQSIPLRASPHRRDMTNPKDVPTTLAPAIEDITVTTKINEDVIIGPNDEEMCPNTLKPLSIAEMENGDEYASGLSQENVSLKAAINSLLGGYLELEFIYIITNS